MLVGVILVIKLQIRWLPVKLSQHQWYTPNTKLIAFWYQEITLQVAGIESVADGTAVHNRATLVHY